MPGGDRTGPRGEGPMTGRGMGYCTGSDLPGYASGGVSPVGFRAVDAYQPRFLPRLGLGLGRGRGAGRGRGGGPGRGRGRRW